MHPGPTAAHVIRCVARDMTLAHQNTQLALLDAHVREHALPACAPRAAVGREEGPGDDDKHIEGARAQEMALGHGRACFDFEQRRLPAVRSVPGSLFDIFH